MKKLFILPFLATLLTVICSCSNDKQTTQLKCMTFNIRYDNPGDSLNSWSMRKDSVAKFISTTHPDIFGLQEVLANQLEDLTGTLTDYDYVGVGRDDGKEAGEFAPVFYDKARFTLLDNGTFWLSQYPDSAGFIGWDGACTRIATWTKLKDNKSGKELCFINTHLDHVGQEAQKNGVNLIMERIEAIAGGNPAILTGDFNVNSESEAYKTVVSHDTLLVDTYAKAMQKDGVTYTFHDFDRVPADERQKIDYVFASPSFEVVKTLIPDEQTMPRLLSDHNPVIVTLTMTTDKQ